ncbi:SDR family oxidoreductase [Streptomyces sp. BH097]|uniref:SDR family oxidoreductase n=1 Tax=unclassified Streptomyces TaxID=2593676 RepID=UPI003BB75519
MRHSDRPRLALQSNFKRSEAGEVTYLPAARLRGKVALVSGGAQGMGLSHARALAREGADVAVFDISAGESSTLPEEFGAEHLLVLHGDVRSASDWEHAVAATCEKFGKLDTLVNNAGVAAAHRVETVAEADFRRVTDINQVGTFLGMRAVLRPMRRAGGGSIINISSTSGLVGFEDNFSYVASKWAVRGMTKAAALELAEDGIRVNTVCPGETDTPLLRSDPTAVPPESSRFGRWARPAEVSAAVVFLASDESSYVSGSDIVVDATYTAA